MISACTLRFLDKLSWAKGVPQHGIYGLPAADSGEILRRECLLVGLGNAVAVVRVIHRVLGVSRTKLDNAKEV